MKNRTIHDRLRHARSHPVCNRRVALVLALVGLVSSVALLLGPSRRASAQGAGPSWTYTGNLNTARAV